MFVWVRNILEDKKRGSRPLLARPIVRAEAGNESAATLMSGVGWGKRGPPSVVVEKCGSV